MPTNTLPGYVPGNFATSQAQYTNLLNDLNNTDPAYWPSLIRKYGNEDYSTLLDALGRTKIEAKIENRQFRHAEDSNLHSSVRAAAQVTGTGAGASVTVAAHSSDHFSSGTKSPLVVGHVYEVHTSGVQAQCTAINTTTPNAHTFTLKPINAADAVTSAGSANILADELFLDRGAVNIGEGSDKISGLFPTWTSIVNTVTEHRDDLNISDVADHEKLQIAIPGAGPGAYRLAATDRLNRRFMNDRTFKIFEGVAANNIAGTYGTVGLIPRVAASGMNIQYTAGSMTIADIQALTRSINFFGGTGDYHAIMDQFTKEAMSDLLFTTYKGTFNNVSWESVGGSKEAAAAYGFDAFRINNVTLHMWVNPMFSTDTIYKRQTSTPGFYKNYCILVPQRLDNRDARNGEVYPSLQVVYQGAGPNADLKIYSYETGGIAPTNKTTKMERNLTQIAYYGTRVFGASQFASFKGI
jgi:hypothetical protein